MQRKVLNESVVISMMREEWQRMKQEVLREVSVSHDGKPLLTPGLKIVDGSGNLYTINSVGNSGAVLEDPDGRASVVPWEKIEKEFKLQ